MDLEQKAQEQQRPALQRLLELERFLKGYDPSHGNMKGFVAEASDESKKAMRWIFDKRHRTIDYDFERKITSDNNVTKRIAEHG